VHTQGFPLITCGSRAQPYALPRGLHPVSTLRKAARATETPHLSAERTLSYLLTVRPGKNRMPCIPPAPLRLLMRPGGAVLESNGSHQVAKASSSGGRKGDKYRKERGGRETHGPWWMSSTYGRYRHRVDGSFHPSVGPAMFLMLVRCDGLKL
jgi:hypothetical protein